MRIKTIFLDMDDVLNDFTMAALKEVGCPVEHFQYEKYDPKWGFDIVRAANGLQADTAFTEQNFWSSLNENFWATIPKSQEYNWLLDQCSGLVGWSEVCILTNPVQKWNPYVAAAKMVWISNFLPLWLHNQFLIGPPKHFCARPDALLIDDSDENVEKFRAFGGQAILMPRPWNSLHNMSPETHLHDTFTNYFQLHAKWSY